VIYVLVNRVFGRLFAALGDAAIIQPTYWTVLM
jgi:hypothetical protein